MPPKYYSLIDEEEAIGSPRSIALQSNFAIQVLRVLLGIQRKLVLIEHLLFDFAVLEENNPISVALQVLIMSDHDNSGAIFHLAVSEVVDFKDQVHDLYGRFRVKVASWFIQQYDGW